MKKLFALLFVLLASFSLISCTGDNKEDPVKEPETSETDGGGTEGTKTQLDAPVISIDSNNIITWTAIENADAYIVSYLTTETRVTETSFDASNLASGTSIKVYAVGSNYKNSAYSNAVTVTKAPSPTLLSIAENAILACYTNGEVTDDNRALVREIATTIITSGITLDKIPGEINKLIVDRPVLDSKDGFENALKICDYFQSFHMGTEDALKCFVNASLIGLDKTSLDETKAILKDLDDDAFHSTAKIMDYAIVVRDLIADVELDDEEDPFKYLEIKDSLIDSLIDNLPDYSEFDGFAKTAAQILLYQMGDISDYKIIEEAGKALTSTLYSTLEISLNLVKEFDRDTLTAVLTYYSGMQAVYNEHSLNLLQSPDITEFIDAVIWGSEYSEEEIEALVSLVDEIVLYATDEDELSLYALGYVLGIANASDESLKAALENTTYLKNVATRLNTFIEAMQSETKPNVSEFATGLISDLGLEEYVEFNYSLFNKETVVTNLATKVTPNSLVALVKSFSVESLQDLVDTVLGEGVATIKVNNENKEAFLDQLTVLANEALLVSKEAGMGVAEYSLDYVKFDELMKLVSIYADYVYDMYQDVIELTIPFEEAMTTYLERVATKCDFNVDPIEGLTFEDFKKLYEGALLVIDSIDHDAYVTIKELVDNAKVVYDHYEEISSDEVQKLVDSINAANDNFNDALEGFKFSDVVDTEKKEESRAQLLEALQNAVKEYAESGVALYNALIPTETEGEAIANILSLITGEEINFETEDSDITDDELEAFLDNVNVLIKAALVFAESLHDAGANAISDSSVLFDDVTGEFSALFDDALTTCGDLSLVEMITLYNEDAQGENEFEAYVKETVESLVTTINEHVDTIFSEPVNDVCAVLSELTSSTIESSTILKTIDYEVVFNMLYPFIESGMAYLSTLASSFVPQE